MLDGTKEESEIIAGYAEYEIPQKLRRGEAVSETQLRCLCQTKVPKSETSFHSALRPNLLKFGEYPIISLLTNAVNIEDLLEQLSHEDTSEVRMCEGISVVYVPMTSFVVVASSICFLLFI